MTSNVGAQILQKDSTLGFNAGQGQEDFEKIKEKIHEDTKRIFKPEFLNRINDTIIFRRLDQEDLNQIVDIELKKLQKRLEQRSIHLSFSAKAKRFLVEKGYDEKLGARPLRRAIEAYLEDALSDAILRGELLSGEVIKVEATTKTLTFKQKPTAKPVS